jgi:hypothetical protein
LPLSTSSTHPGYIITLSDNRCVYDTHVNALAADKRDLGNGKSISIELLQQSKRKKTRNKKATKNRDMESESE